MNINENTSGVCRWLVPVSKDLGGGTLSTKCHSSFECVNAPVEHFEFCLQVLLTISGATDLSGEKKET